MREQLETLAALRTKVTEECLDDDGRYFADGYGDLTQCTHGETGNYRNRYDGKAIAILWNLWKDGALAPRDEWRTMDSAPTDGTVIEACARVPHATAGFPQYISFIDGNWHTASYHRSDIVIPWAWRPRTEWPQEHKMHGSATSTSGKDQA